MKKFFADFKAFINRGNILDMAGGVVVGGAFSKIISSLVADIITPLISLATGKVALNDLKWEITAETAINYGNFLQVLLDFLIIAFSIFVAIRAMMKAQEKLERLTKKQIEEAAAAEPTTKTCPHCQSEISIKATRCPYCTSKLKE